MIMKKNNYLVFLSSVFVLNVLVSFNIKAQNEGEQIFTTICIACHTIGGVKFVGPDLKDVQKRHSEEWLVKFIRS